MQKIAFIFFIFFFLLEYSYAKDEYFMTLRNDIVNLRQGPSFDHPIKIFYKKKFLPILVQDSSENFRKIKDHENNSGWIHISQLSKKKAAIVIDTNIIVFSKPSVYSTPSVILEKGRLCKIIKCKDNWCKIKVDNYKGWIKKNSLWGLL
jgi:SH3-like domain-containing protein|tara:strand:- start:486 stop:932 length:447 start_codon:yes stop_codon:yes gene_type:complete